LFCQNGDFLLYTGLIQKSNLLYLAIKSCFLEAVTLFTSTLKISAFFISENITIIFQRMIVYSDFISTFVKN